MSALPPCHRCRHPNSQTNAFCAQCGAQMPTQTLRGVTGLPPWVKLFLIITGTLLIAFFGMMAVAITSPQSLAPPPTALVSTAAAGVATQASTQQAPAPLPTITNADRLAKARQKLKSTSRNDLDVAEGHLNNVPQGAPEYREAQSLLQQVAARRAPLLREELAAQYRGVVSRANQHLNYIETKHTKIKGGYALWATHEFFTQYSLSAGDDAHIISAWIDAHRGELREAGVVRVGLMGRGAYASWSYFDVK